jgi:hypothetical protein
MLDDNDPATARMSATVRSDKPGWLQQGMIRGHMLGKTMLPGDEELGKKDDDHRFAPARRSGWSIWNHTFRWRRRRILLVLAALVLGCVVLKRFGRVGGETRYPMGRPATPAYTPNAYDEPVEPVGPPTRTHIRQGEAPSHTFDGPIRFYRLAKTLRKSAARTAGYENTNRNVLFAMANLNSASNLLPMVCEMATWSRTHVHAAFMGRDDMALDELLAVNGVDRAKCPAIWHDARSDYMEYSSDARAESAVVGAISHVQSFLHPQAVIMDDSLSEDVFFVRGMRNKTEALHIPLIEVPKNKWDDFMWLTRLDAGSLNSWHVPTVDLLIQVPSASSSVLRLLKSIKDADYSGLRPPRIILELPADLDESVQRQVENFKWPPNNDHPLAGSGVLIRRRISNPRATQEDAAIRFLELFYPANRDNSHVLLLSPEAQLSPLYFHFIKYTLLEYKYSTFGREDNGGLLGVSLELPSVLLDAKTKLNRPTLTKMGVGRYKKLFPHTPSAPFLWQAPNSHATLFFGAKWVELHSFLSHRIVKHQQSHTKSRPKIVSETLPAWTEYMLELIRARGYALLYPAASAEAFITIHNELYHAPEEFVSKPNNNEPSVLPETDEPFLRGDAPVRPPKNPESPVIPGSRPLHLALPFDGDLPEVPHLPHMLYNGLLVDPVNFTQTAKDYANKFREEIGGCTIPKGKHRKVIPSDARDLFCYGDEDESDWEDDVSDESVDADILDDYEYDKGSVDTKGSKTAVGTMVSTKFATSAELPTPTEKKTHTKTGSLTRRAFSTNASKFVTPTATGDVEP